MNIGEKIDAVIALLPSTLTVHHSPDHAAYDVCRAAKLVTRISYDALAKLAPASIAAQVGLAVAPDIEREALLASGWAVTLFGPENLHESWSKGPMRVVARLDDPNWEHRPPWLVGLSEYAPNGGAFAISAWCYERATAIRCAEALNAFEKKP